MNVVKDDWKESVPLKANLKQVTEHLQQWNRDKFGHVLQRKRRLWARIGVGGVLESTCNSQNEEPYKA